MIKPFIVGPSISSTSGVNVGIQFTTLQENAVTFLMVLQPPRRLEKKGPVEFTFTRYFPIPLMLTERNVSTIEFTIGPASYNKFAANMITVTIPSWQFHCRGKSVDVVVTITIFPLPLAIPQAVSATVATAASFIAVASVSPAAASTAARISILQNLLQCQFDDSIDAYSITTLTIGPAANQGLRGAVVGNWLLFFGMSSLVLLVAAIFSVVVACKHGASFRMTMMHLLCVLHFPSILAVPGAVIFQPTLAASMSLLWRATMNADVILGVFGLVMCLVVAVHLTIPLVVGFSCELQPRREQLAWWQKFIDSEKHWVCLGGRNRWKQRYLVLFSDFSNPWYPAVDMWIGLCAAMFSGVVIESRGFCSAQLIVTGIGYVTVLIIQVVTWPTLSPLSMVFSVVANVSGATASICGVIAAYTNGANALRVSSIATLLLGIVSMAQSIVAAIVCVVAAPKLIHDAWTPFAARESMVLQENMDDDETAVGVGGGVIPHTAHDVSAEDVVELTKMEECPIDPTAAVGLPRGTGEPSSVVPEKRFIPEPSVLQTPEEIDAMLQESSVEVVEVNLRGPLIAPPNEWTSDLLRCNIEQPALRRPPGTESLKRANPLGDEFRVVRMGAASASPSLFQPSLDTAPSRQSTLQPTVGESWDVATTLEDPLRLDSPATTDDDIL